MASPSYLTIARPDVTGVTAEFTKSYALTSPGTVVCSTIAAVCVNAADDDHVTSRPSGA